ncbi:uncharacterized protein B0I36DRAFT_29725 [Microdochium trichocladiopsis]|uniref:Uncharacterized protein n=1 Tax=Microdochium trichocladiopsis TaxID=1682393 RepID=A0A9P9BKG3_9PEZI|nr:uncharacterized protein B0I36DRAFT_29725 [Microdochium trichocladiopsis]KAH7021176.1 hypothetical protein B0I36DRAFT_29725 [Microdochium trichocladiopsis]
MSRRHSQPPPTLCSTHHLFIMNANVSWVVCFGVAVPVLVFFLVICISSALTSLVYSSCYVTFSFPPGKWRWGTGQTIYICVCAWHRKKIKRRTAGLHDLYLCVYFYRCIFCFSLSYPWSELVPAWWE